MLWAGVFVDSGSIYNYSCCLERSQGIWEIFRICLGLLQWRLFYQSLRFFPCGSSKYRLAHALRKKVNCLRGQSQEVMLQLYLDLIGIIGH